ncbi:MAG: WD40/YVTN/BNR-like repeat-containing protein [Vicinamibacterales bacterium]
MVFLVAAAFAQSAAPRKPAQKAPAVQRKPLYKGIFEPVNYPKDINLLDVFFVTPDIGWVAGEHATILKTTDGGNHWVAEIGGDPGRGEPKIGQLRFLDEQHGWAIQDGPKLLRTMDGQNWDEVKGEFPRGVPVLDYAFTSVDHGILLGGNGDAFYVTEDGGGHWTSVGPCRLNATVQGLAQTPSCHFIQLQMFSDRSGLALAWWDAGANEQLVLFRTDDAGAHWSNVVPDVIDSRYVQMFFTDLNHGVLLFSDMKTCVTSDGGKTWRTLLSGKIDLASGASVRFADPQVGWALGHSPHNRDAFRVSFTTDGGQHWQDSGDIAFPGSVLTDLHFAFPRRDRAYVIGPHGMIYRYRIVPAAYTAPHMLPGPLMPAAR